MKIKIAASLPEKAVLGDAHPRELPRAGRPGGRRCQLTGETPGTLVSPPREVGPYPWRRTPAAGRAPRGDGARSIPETRLQAAPGLSQVSREFRHDPALKKVEGLWQALVFLKKGFS